MKFLRSHFALSRSQQNGIFVLVILIISFQAFMFFDFSSESESNHIDQVTIKEFQERLDSINQVSNRHKDTIYPFNPNYISDFKGYQLGMSLEEIDRLLAFRESGKWINSVEDFQKVSGVSDSLLKKISPSFRFPEWTQKRNSVNIQQKDARPVSATSDLNSASAEDLKLINGIGEVLSQRIVKYRTSIGGFLSAIQLNDVYGLTPEVIARINENFEIRSKPDIVIKNLNLINEEELSEIPYFSSNLAKEVIKFRTLYEGFSSFEELSKIEAFPYDKIDRIKLYLAIK
ncbi:helix-hairpin-helix domain-containing protein [Christiangramia sp.]|uniref:helix-hairpin-helix domain-containing protein n=1 Tax=Christiangramia sp. TaxID=1931228 RepID=UPI002622033B|nr:helix-hairpin-helix domain-containing protein [Christiangramia sp.]